MSEIYSNLYLGNVVAAGDEKFLKKSKISHILIAAEDIEPSFTTGYTYKQLPLVDVPEIKIIEYFVESIKFIDQARESGKTVLVHCLGGVSRSATLVIAYVMVKEEKSLKDAFAFVHKRRSKINPNPGFIAQLEIFEKALKTYFKNMKGEKIDYQFLDECVKELLPLLDKIKVKK